MKDGKITSDMKVWKVVRKHPQTARVFLSRGCPDMQKGFFSFMARIMSVKNAARIHGIPLQELVRDLNAAAESRVDPDGSSTSRAG